MPLDARKLREPRHHLAARTIAGASMAAAFARFLRGRL